MMEVQMPTSAIPHLYVDCDLPEGVTLAEWRRANARPAQATPGRKVRRAGARLARRLALRA